MITRQTALDNLRTRFTTKIHESTFCTVRASWGWVQPTLQALNSLSHAIMTLLSIWMQISRTTPVISQIFYEQSNKQTWLLAHDTSREGEPLTGRRSGASSAVAATSSLVLCSASPFMTALPGIAAIAARYCSVSTSILSNHRATLFKWSWPIV